MQNNYTTQVAPVSHTVLFIDGIPVRYKIFQNDIGFLLHPVVNPAVETKAPLIVATRYHGYWQIDDLRDQNLIDQVSEDLDLLITEPVLISTALSVH